jgi:hypothetical protein
LPPHPEKLASSTIVQAGHGKQIRNAFLEHWAALIWFDTLESSFDVVDLTFSIEGFVYEHF